MSPTEYLQAARQVAATINHVPRHHRLEHVRIWAQLAKAMLGCRPVVLRGQGKLI